MKKLFIRIHPLLPQRGYRSQRFSIYGYLFEEKRGWYVATFSDEQWRYLRNVHNDENNPDSPRVFQIVDEAGKKEIDEADRQVKIQALAQPQASVVDLTSGELRGDAPTVRAERTRSMRAASFDEQQEAARGEQSEPTWSDDLTTPEKKEAVAPAPKSERRGRGRPRKSAGAVTPVEG